MTEEKYKALKEEWGQIIGRETKDSYEFFTQPENDLQALIPLLLKYQKENDFNSYGKTIDAFFTMKARWGFCGEDLSKLDLSMLSADSLARITFDTSTKWPTKSKLSKGFNPLEIIEKVKSYKGLGVEELHKQGIKGKGVKVAYIDKGFDVEHQEFEGRNIEYINFQKDERYDFHAYAVASRLIGKNIGVAPDVDMIYFNCEGEGEKRMLAMIKYECKALKAILDRLKNREKIVAVGISGSIPYQSDMALERKEISEKGRNTLLQNYNRILGQLKEHGCQVISSDEFFGSGFDYAYKIKPLADNSNLDNYAQFNKAGNKISVIDADKLVPSVFTKNGYKYENTTGCASWSIPQVVGLYCLAKQVSPKVTYEEFVKIAKQTAHQPNKNGVRLIDSIALIKEVSLLNVKN